MIRRRTSSRAPPFLRVAAWFAIWRQRPQNPKNNSARQYRAWMNPATKALSSLASAAVNGIAGLIFLTPTGIHAHRNRVLADSLAISPPNDPLAIAQQPP